VRKGGGQQKYNYFKMELWKTIGKFIFNTILYFNVGQRWNK